MLSRRDKWIQFLDLKYVNSKVKHIVEEIQIRSRKSDITHYTAFVIISYVNDVIAGVMDIYPEVQVTLYDGYHGSVKIVFDWAG